MMTKKKEFKLIEIFEFEKLEKWLVQMHREGWKFTDVNLLDIYCFEKCEPQEVIYRMDYQVKRMGDDYFQLFSDCGWEHVFNMNGFHIFRKNDTECNDGLRRDAEIFSNDESRLGMIKRIFRGRFIGGCLLAAGTLAGGIVLINQSINNIQYAANCWGLFLFSMCIVYAYMMLIIGKRYFNFEKQMGDASKALIKWRVFIGGCATMAAVAETLLIWGIVR